MGQGHAASNGIDNIVMHHREACDKGRGPVQGSVDQTTPKGVDEMGIICQIDIPKSVGTFTGVPAVGEGKYQVYGIEANDVIKCGSY